MQGYWNYKDRRAKITEDIEQDGAQPWDSTWPKSDIFVGAGQVFISPSDYDIDGYSLNAQDLEELLQKIRS